MILQPACWSYRVISCLLYPPPSMRVLLTMSYNIMLNIIPTLYESYIVSVHRMVMENRPVDPGSIQGSHRPISVVRTKHRTRAKVFLGQTPESDIPPSYRATRRYIKIHLGFCLRFSTLIGQIGRVALFGAGPTRYIRSRLFRLAVTAFWRALTASWRQKGKREQRSFLGPFSSTELPSNPSPLTFRNNQIQILQISSTHATVAADVSQQDTNTRGTSLSHARTHIQRETKI